MDTNELYRLEESLWKAETRFDRDYMEHIFDIDFREFGRSGRKYNRAQMLFNRDQEIEINAVFPLKDFKVQKISKDVYLVTYVSDVTFSSGTEIGNRTSIWKTTKTGWKLMFHQGTAVT